VTAAKVFYVAGQAVSSLSAGPRVYVQKPDKGPDWGLRVTLTLIFRTTT
jgi:hypothetical protein